MAFKYTPLSRDQVKARTEQKATILDPIFSPEFKVFRPKVGINVVRFLPPTWDQPKSWDYDVFLHRNVGSDNGTYLCLNRMLREPCPICDERKALDTTGDSEAAKQIRVQQSRVAWILDRADEEAGTQLWLYGYTISQDIAGRLVNIRTGREIDMLHPDDGYDISFRRGDEKPYPKTTQVDVDREPSPICDDQQWQDYYLNYIQKHPVPDCLQYYDHEHIANILHGRRKTRSAEDSEHDVTRHTPSRRPPPPTDDYEESQQPAQVEPAARRRPPPDEEDARGGAVEQTEVQPARRQLPPEDNDRGRNDEPAPSRRAPPPEDVRRDDAPPAGRRRAPPPDDDARGEPEAGGNTTEQARRQIEGLRDEANGSRRTAPPAEREPEGEPAPPSGRRRAPPPEDDAPPARRRPPAP